MRKFTTWQKWSNRSDLIGIEYPGVYCLLMSKTNMSGKEFSWDKRIVYIGMTNARKGLKGRLKQFDNTMKGKSGHGGADRFKFVYRDYDIASSMLYVAVAPIECDVLNYSPKDLKKMGSVAKLEYDSLAEYLSRFDKLPDFNDKKKSPKYSAIKKTRNRTRRRKV